MVWRETTGQWMRWLRASDAEIIMALNSFAYSVSSDFVDGLIYDQVSRQISYEFFPLDVINNVTRRTINASDVRRATTNPYHAVATDGPDTAEDQELFRGRYEVSANGTVLTLLALAFTLVLGPLSDIYGRQLAVLLPLIGRLVSLCCQTSRWAASPSAWPSWSLVWQVLPEGLCGGVSLLNVGLYSLLRDGYTEGGGPADRARLCRRVALLLGLDLLATQLGDLVGMGLVPRCGGVTDFAVCLALSALVLMVAFVIVGGERRKAVVNVRLRTVCVNPCRGYGGMFVTTFLKWYLLAGIVFYLGQTVETIGTPLINGLELSWAGEISSFTSTMENLTSIIGYLLVAPLILSRFKSISEDVVGMLGTVAMVFMCIARAMDDSHSFYAAFAISCLMLIGCMGFVATYASVANSVTSQEIGSAMTALGLLSFVSGVIGGIVVPLILAHQNWFPGTVLIIAAAILGVAFLIYAKMRKRRRQSQSCCMEPSSSFEKAPPQP